MRLRCISLLRYLTNSSITNLETSVAKHNETFKNFPIRHQARRLISQTSSSSAKPNIHEVAQEKTKTNITCTPAYPPPMMRTWMLPRASFLLTPDPIIHFSKI